MTAGIALLALWALAAEAPAPPAPARVLTLGEAEAAARAHQPQLQAAAAATAAALARTGEARAALLPQISANGSYQRATANFVARPGSLPRQIGTGGGSESFDSSGFFNLGLNASYNLYDFGQVRGRYRASEANLLSSTLGS